MYNIENCTSPPAAATKISIFKPQPLRGALALPASSLLIASDAATLTALKALAWRLASHAASAL
jgi:hypothetical protein